MCAKTSMSAKKKALAHMGRLAHMTRAGGPRRLFGGVRRTQKGGQQASLAPFGARGALPGGLLGGFAPMSAKEEGLATPGGPWTEVPVGAKPQRLAHMSALARMRRGGSP
jgi:hypothetical protein